MMDQRLALDWIPGLGEEVDSNYQENTHEIKVLAHIADQMNTNMFSQGWKSAQQLDISLQWHREWQDYINALSESHIRIKEGPDKLVWSLAENGIYTPKAEYLNLISHKQPEQTKVWWKSIWKLVSPPRTRLFFWCILRNKVPTGESLSHRSFHGPHRCVLCKNSSESTVHLFLQCETLSNLWQIISSSIHLSGKISAI